MRKIEGKSENTTSRKSGMSLGWLIRFVTRDIWMEDVPEGDAKRKGVVGFLRWAYLVWHGFVTDQCLLRASALTYTTVLSIVPFVAVAFSISKGLGLQDTEAIRLMLLQASAGNEQTVDHILQYVHNTNVGTLGAVGMVALLATVGSLMATIEKAFNAIWGIAVGRSLWRKFTDFFSVVLICPLLMGVAISVSVSMQHESVVQRLLEYSAVNYAYVIMLKLVPLVIVGGMLLFLYVFIPTTRVRIPSALVGAGLAAVLWKMVEGVYVGYQVGAAKYNAIYGGFAQVPLFLIWTYVSWVIVLLGVEVCFALQNVKTFESELRAHAASREERDQVATLSMLLLTRSFVNGTGAVPLRMLTEIFKAPVRLVQDVMHVLEVADLVVRVEGDEPAYVLAMPPEDVRILDVILAMSTFKPTASELPLSRRFAAVTELFSTLYADAEKSAANLSIADAVKRMPDDFSSADFVR